MSARMKTRPGLLSHYPHFITEPCCNKCFYPFKSTPGHMSVRGFIKMMWASTQSKVCLVILLYKCFVSIIIQKETSNWIAEGCLVQPRCTAQEAFEEPTSHKHCSAVVVIVQVSDRHSNRWMQGFPSAQRMPLTDNLEWLSGCGFQWKEEHWSRAKVLGNSSSVL